MPHANNAPHLSTGSLLSVKRCIFISQGRCCKTTVADFALPSSSVTLVSITICYCWDISVAEGIIWLNNQWFISRYRETITICHKTTRPKISFLSRLLDPYITYFIGYWNEIKFLFPAGREGRTCCSTGSSHHCWDEPRSRFWQVQSSDKSKFYT